MIYAILAGVVALFVLLRILQSKRMRGIPSVPGGLPFVGHVMTLMKGSAWDKFAEWVPQYGKIFSVSIFTSEMICVADPAILKVVLQTKMNSFMKDREWTYKPFLVLLGNGLVTSHGKNWLRQRAVMANHLKYDILEDIPAASLKGVNRLVAKLHTYNKAGKVPEMAEEFRHLTLQVIAELLLSLSPEESDDTFAKMYLPIVEEGNLRVWQPWRMHLPIPAWFKFQRDVKKLDDYVTSLMLKRRELREKEKVSGDSKRARDVLDIMLNSIDKPGDNSLPWNEDTIKQFRDEIKTFVLAGHETSASMLAWALFELSLPENAHMLKRVIDEANEVFGDCKDQKGKVVRMPPREKLSKLVYAECCLRESLRKYSVVPTVVRVAAEDVQANDSVFIPKGATLMVSMQGVHHNPDIWPEPLKYRPDRFLEEVKPYTFLPFVEGPRMCLGQFLSILESKIVLSILLLNFSFVPLNPAEAAIKHKFMIPIIPEHGHFLKPVPKVEE
jgi:cytochrome P450